MDKNIKLGNEKIIAGVNKLANTVKVTMGGKGKLVIVEDFNNIAPIVTKDGVTVANYVDLEDSFENQGAMLMKQASKRTVDEVGDSTTTSVVLAQALINEGKSSGKSYRQLQEQYDKGLELVTKEMKKLSKKGSSLNVAKIASNGDMEIAKLVSQAYKKVGLVLSEESVDNKSSLVFEEGCQIESGSVHEAFSKTVLGKSLFIIYNEKLKSLKPIESILESAVADSMGVLLAVDGIEDSALYQILYNVNQGNLKMNVINIPSEKEAWFEDMTVATGARPIDDFTNDIVSCVGELSKVVAGGNKTQIVLSEEFEEEVARHVKQLTDKRRIANLGSGVCTIKVGGASNAERVEKLDRVDDAIGAVSSSMKYGVVPGGGSTFAYLSETLDVGTEFKKALLAPREVIYTNAEISVDKLTSVYNQGFDVVSGEYQQDLFKAGIVDSTEGLIKALESAVSVAKIVLQTEGIILTVNK